MKIKCQSNPFSYYLNNDLYSKVVFFVEPVTAVHKTVLLVLMIFRRNINEPKLNGASQYIGFH